MQKLLHRALRAYRTEGFVSTIKKSACFASRYLRHVLGTKGLYRSSCYQKLLHWWNSRPYSAVDPFTIVHVNPNEITYVTGRGPNPGRFQWQDLGKVQDGDWDLSDHRVDDLPVVQALQQRFENEKNWEEIEFIEEVVEEAKRGIVTWRGCENKADVQKACTRVDEIYHSIRNEGYLSMNTLVEQGTVPKNKYIKGDGFNRYDEVTVDIGRHGQFLFVDGRHRLAIAQILEIDTIPVRISVRHANWQQKREILYETSADKIPSEIIKNFNHPDLQKTFIEDI